MFLACRTAPAAGTQAPSSPLPVETGDLAVMNDAGAYTLLADVQRSAPEIRVGLRYATADNFTGAPLPGYEGNHAYLRREAAAALARVAQRAGREGYALYVFDAYRPVRATDAMVAWTEGVGGTDLTR